ncbi:MAG TPA: type II CAAX endopeptidase family protein [Puia sp.]|jgi:membrane protease YdiL (CAAX protease family)|nr:type II CAAX endopeptidase family protein [Puia sp.]
MNQRLKIPSPWAQLGLFMALLGGCYVFTLLFLSLLHRPGQGIGWEKFEQMLASIGVFALPGWLFARMTTHGKASDLLGFRKAQLPVFYAIGVLLLLLSFPFEGWLGQLNRHIPLSQWMVTAEKEATEKMGSFLRVDSTMDIVVNVIIIAAIPAVCEEICFRGALQRILIQCFNSPWAGIVFTGAFFSAFHLQFQGFLPRMFMGILLGAAYWYSGSLWVSILAHFFINATQVIAVSYYPKMIDEDPYVPVYLALLSLAIVVGLLSVFRRRSRTSYAEVYADNDNHYSGFPE